MEALAYYDGKIGTPEELMVPFNDRVHFFGDGVYDATVGANGKVYLMQDHLDRFYTSAKALDIHIPMPKEELGKLLTDLLAKVDGTTHFVYWQVTRGVETRNHVYAENLPGKLWVSIRQNHLNDPDVAIKLNTAEDTRFYHCNIKTLNLLPSVVAAQHAKRIGGYEEAKTNILKFFDKKGYIMMAIMMGGGIALREFGIIPAWIVAFMYTGIGSALALAGIGFFIHYLKRGRSLTCPVTKKTRLA